VLPCGSARANPTVLASSAKIAKEGLKGAGSGVEPSNSKRMKYRKTIIENWIFPI
jgi:hypothetical protein